MKERYRHEIPRWLRLLGAWRINKDSIDFNWGYFAPRRAFSLTLHRGGYFDQRFAVTIALGWGEFHFKLPFKTKLTKGCNMPRYGIAIHGDSFWVYTGGEFDHSIGQVTRGGLHAWDLPYFSYTFDGHWIQNKKQDWVKMGNFGSSYYFKKDGLAYTEKHPFTYVLNDGTLQERIATCTIERRKWHRKWFPFLKRENVVIDIEFSDEVGEGSGSWKGGIMGMSHELLPNETIAESLERLKQKRNLW